MVMTLLFVILPDDASNRMPRKRSSPPKQPYASVNEVLMPTLSTFAVAAELLSTAPRNPPGGSIAVMVCPLPSTLPPGGIEIVISVDNVGISTSLTDAYGCFGGD